MYFSRSKAVSLAIAQREDDEGLKARFHKPEDIFSHRCRRHRHASRCFLGFSSKKNNELKHFLYDIIIFKRVALLYHFSFFIFHLAKLCFAQIYSA